MNKNIDSDTDVETEQPQQYHHSDLTIDSEINSPCVVWGTPHGDLFIDCDNEAFILDEQEITLIQNNKITIDMLAKVYSTLH